MSAFRRPLLAAAAASAVIGLSLGSATVAHAASVSTNCAGLAAALAGAANGDTITLTQLCTASNSGSANGHFSLPANISLTLTGTAGAGFNGTGVSGRVLTATGTTNDATVLISHLLFENSTATSAGGGALEVTGQVNVTLDSDTFSADSAGTTGPGGAVEIVAFGNADTVTISNSTFTGNSTSSTGGGAAEVEVDQSGSTVNITGDTFTSNHVTATGVVRIDGGALLVQNFNVALPALNQSHNLFQGNSIAAGPTGSLWGGGESAIGLKVTSLDDRFLLNSIPAPPTGTTSSGSGLSILNNDCNTTAPAHLATNLDVAGNTIASGSANPDGAWGAVYLGCGPGSGSTDHNNLTIENGTISGNTGGGGTAGIWGDTIDQLTLQNTILNGDTNGTEIDGFTGTGGSITVQYSDLCNGSAPYTGTGNICANAQLVSPSTGDIHETTNSPTIDTGNNALVTSGVTTDYEGDARIQAKQSGGTPIVDMGADEFGTLALTITPVPSTGAGIWPAGGVLVITGLLMLGLRRRRARR